MCVLILVNRPTAELTLVVAANRDEYYDRPSAPPTVLGAGVFGGRDLQGGGTWLGISRAALLVAVTNRRVPARKPEGPSRGQLCLAALGCRDVEEVETLVRHRVQQLSYAGFNLVAVQGDHGVCLQYDGVLRATRIESGLHVISSDWDLDQPGMPEREVVLRRIKPWATMETLIEDLGAIVQDHTDESAICKHEARYGTVSSSLLALGPAGPLRYLHAPGPPCRTVFEDYTEAAARVVNP